MADPPSGGHLEEEARELVSLSERRPHVHRVLTGVVMTQSM